MFEKVLNTLLLSKPINAIKSCKAETNHMANFKATYISVLNHWKTFETTLKTESDNLPAKLALLYHPTSSLINNLIFIYYYQYLVDVFASILKFSQIFSYNFIKLVFCFNIIL